MKWLVYTIVAALMVTGALAAPVTLFVSPRGNDAWSGTLADANAAGTDGPFATLARARDEVRKLRGAGPVTVYVRGGLYPLSTTLSLSAEDSGSRQTPVVWRATPGEQPILIGGKTITGFTPYQGKILKADVAAQGLKDVTFRQLLCNGKRMDLARYPNHDFDHPVTGGWAYADGKPVPMYVSIEGEPRNVLHYSEADARTWAHPEEGEVMVFPRYNWWNNIIRIKSLDREQRTLTLTSDASYPIRPGDRYWVQNLFEELDAPGEWYLDKATGTLYFWPPDGADPTTMTVCAPVLRTILELKDGAAYVTFRGFTFECAEGTAIVMRDTNDCRLEASVIRNVGDYNGSGVSVGGGHGNSVVGCDIHDVGRDAISLNGGNRDTLEPAANVADNNYLHHTGVYYKQGVGVSVNGVGNRASHNLIHDCPRFGIVWGGSDHVLEYNEIRHCNLETADCGAIYSWQVDWSKRGTEIRYNYLHDIVGFGQENGKWVSPHMNWGVYLDDGTCGVHVYGNVIVRTILGGVHVHGGRDNVIENNILVDGRDNEMQYSGYVKGGHPVPMMTEAWNKFHGTAAYLKYPGYEAARLYAHANLPFDQTESDYNLIWSEGQPLRTGVTRTRSVSGPNLAPSPDFEAGEPGKLPEGWRWGVRPNKSEAGLDVTQHLSGKQSLKIVGDGTVTDASGQRLVVNFNSQDIPMKPGQTYRLAASFRADEPTSCAIMPQAYEAGKYFWARHTGVKAGPEWQRVECTFRFPAPGDSDHHEGMSKICIRLDVSQGTGTIWVDDVELREADVMTEWKAWQALGLDTHSVIADPRFVDRAADNYRLQPDSPAFKLGFKPIPMDQIGPYQDELRASWPIQQAVGAREQMKLDWAKH